MTVITQPRPELARFHQDGWTPHVQTLLLDKLMTTGSIREAARAGGKTASVAYKLREHPNGAAFKAAWLRAIGVCMECVRETAIDRVFMAGSCLSSTTGCRSARSWRSTSGGWSH